MKGNSVTPFHVVRRFGCVKSPMSVILSCRSISERRSNCNDLNPPSARETVARTNGGAKRCRNKSSFPAKIGREGKSRRRYECVPQAGRHVSRAVISFFMAGYAGTLRSFNANVVRAIFGREP